MTVASQNMQTGEEEVEGSQKRLGEDVLDWIGASTERRAPQQDEATLAGAKEMEGEMYVDEPATSVETATGPPQEPQVRSMEELLQKLHSGDSFPVQVRPDTAYPFDETKADRLAIIGYPSVLASDL